MEQQEKQESRAGVHVMPIPIHHETIARENRSKDILHFLLLFNQEIQLPLHGGRICEVVNLIDGHHLSGHADS